eukprot:scaffold16329_cov121-Isochrysis_galbana.AAC.3
MSESGFFSTTILTALHGGNDVTVTVTRPIEVNKYREGADLCVTVFFLGNIYSSIIGGLLSLSPDLLSQPEPRPRPISRADATRMRAYTYSSRVVGGLSRGAVWRALGGVGVFVEAVNAVDAVALEGRVGLEFAFDLAGGRLHQHLAQMAQYRKWYARAPLPVLAVSRRFALRRGHSTSYSNNSRSLNLNDLEACTSSELIRPICDRVGVSTAQGARGEGEMLAASVCCCRPAWAPSNARALSTECRMSRTTAGPKKAPRPLTSVVGIGVFGIEKTQVL